MTDEPELYDLGVVGLAVMGRNLALNLSDHGFTPCTWDLDPTLRATYGSAGGAGSAATLQELVGRLRAPKVVLLMIRAGAPIDDVLGKLTPLLQPGDTVIDGGNSHYTDTQRRQQQLQEHGLHLMGLGVSGGEEGARNGPALMPGGSREAWTRCEAMLTAIAARSALGPCVAHLGPDGAGHFVKMVHNGIEYGDMQLIAECYDLLSRGAGLDADAVGDIFAEFNSGPLESFLTELTAQVLKVKEPASGRPLVDLVLDRAGQKGTGRWTVTAALELGVPIPTIAAAVDARSLSSLWELRQRFAEQLPPAAPGSEPAPAPACSTHQLAAALLLAKTCSYAQGLALLTAASEHYDWQLPLAEIARLWTGGCIIRARLLRTLREALAKQPHLPHLLLSPELSSLVTEGLPALRATVQWAVSLGIPVPALSASLAYLQSLQTARLPQNLTQAQRDAFGAHTYQRTDLPEVGAIHSDWLKQ